MAQNAFSHSGLTGCLAKPQLLFGIDPGQARARLDESTAILENDLVRFTWALGSGTIRPVRFENVVTGEAIDFDGGECFEVLLDQSPSRTPRRVVASQLLLDAGVTAASVEPAQTSACLSKRLRGERLVAEFREPGSDLHAVWSAALRDGDNAVRITLRLSAEALLAAESAVLWDVRVPKAEVCGEVDGSPVFHDQFFLAVEHPRARNHVVPVTGGHRKRQARIVCSLPALSSVLGRDPDVVFGAVIGVAPPEQRRRAFLYYLERARAQPYRQFLHYNNGYEIGCEYWKWKCGERPEEAVAFRYQEQKLWMENIERIGYELVEKRGVAMESAVHDFMWDDEDLLWRFHEGYPMGFGPTADVAARYGAGIGVWYSPFGGYAGRAARIAAGKKEGYQITPLGLTLACPQYYARFATSCLNMLRGFDANYFKFDGFGAGNNHGGAEDYACDVDALLTVVSCLRDESPAVFVNCSTGSWPSPFWLLWADVVWRQGADSQNVGKGSNRQRWITYRDAMTYEHVVRKSPQYPLTSLMLHGIFINRAPFAGSPFDAEAEPQSLAPEDIIAEVQTFFGSGVALQELYTDYQLVPSESWEVIAACATWARTNMDVLVDSHWIGGDPAQLPAGSAGRFTLSTPLAPARNDIPAETEAGAPCLFRLCAFESVIIEAIPTE
jgi:hypothetical protein